MARVMDLRKGKPQQAPSSAPRRAPAPQPSREPKRVAPLRVRKRRKRLAIAAFILIIVGAAAYGIHWASYLPQYSIQNIDISGTVSLTRDDILARVNAFFDRQGRFISPRNIFWYDTKGLERDLESDILHIANATLSRDSLTSTTLRISIDERIPFARWCASETSCYVIDKTGFIFATYDASSTSPLEAEVFTGGVSDPGNPLGHSVAAARFPSLLAMIQSLGQAGYSVHKADIDENGDLAFALDTGFTLYASAGADPLSLLRDLKLILISAPLKDHLTDLEYIDLRFGNRVFYKLKGQEAVGQ